METHEIIHVTLDGEEHEIVRSMGTSPKQQQAPQAQTDDDMHRGWSELKEITTLKGRGFGHKQAWFWYFLCLAALIFLPVDPDSRHLVLSNPTANYWTKIVPTFITFLLVIGVYFAKPKIIISKMGFHWCIFHRKIFVPWQGCSKFEVRTVVEEKGLVMKDKTRDFISFQHATHPAHTTPISLANVSPKALCETMNKYRNAYQNVKSEE